MSVGLCVSACRQQQPPPPLHAQIAGTMSVAGIGAAVRIVRDRWGVPHIYAESRDDVFFAQGFVQAQDRLFQMELWRRSAEGRLAEVLGANFIERDAMTRRLQYRGDRNTEWASYGTETRPIAEAFVRGVNAWSALARMRPPELFAVAGWPIVFWTADDLLTRTDSFDRDGTIADAEAQGLPDAVVDSVRRAAVPAFFTGLARPPSSSPGNVAPATVDRTVESGAAMPSPSRYYLIHLHTPNWNAIGAAVPWRPGIVIGHDASARFEQPETRLRARVRVTRFDPQSGRIEQDAIPVKGRAEPFVSLTQITPEGVVVATDRAGGRQYTLTWAGHETGTAPAFAASSASAASPLRRARPDAALPLRRDGANQPARPVEPTRTGDRSIVFVHPLAISDAARARFNVGPLRPPPTGPLPFLVAPDLNVRDASRAMNAPGQSEDPESQHFADLAALWADGHSITLAYTDGAVNANAAATLTLVPGPRR